MMIPAVVPAPMRLVILTTDTLHHARFVEVMAQYYPIERVLLETTSVLPPYETGHPFEAGGRFALRKGLVAARDLEAGTELTREDLMYARPATEFAASELPAVVGRVLERPLKRGQLLPRDAIRSR